MRELRFGWHMPAFPVDGSNATAFVEQIHHILRRVHPHFDSVWVDDHLIPWLPDFSNDTPYVECLTTIAYLAAAHPTITFGASVVCQSYRNPALLAKMVANIQLLTGGRFLFGIGAGWMEEEYRAYNFGFPKGSVRVDQMEETIRVSSCVFVNQKEGRMRLGFNGATTQTADLATDIRVAGQAGYDVIELRDNKLEDFLAGGGALEDVRRMLDEAGVAPWTINAISYVGVGGAEGTARAVARCRELSRMAQAIGCPWVLVVPGATEGRSAAQVLKDTAATLREMADAAAEYGVNVAFEFMGFPWAAVRDVAGAWAVVQEAGRPNLGIVIDTTHFYAGDSTLASIAEIDPGKLAVLHINDVEDIAKADILDGHRLYPGDGVLPLNDILGAAQASGWDGVLSVELFREEYWKLDPLAVAREAKAKSVAAWDRAVRGAQ